MGVRSAIAGTLTRAAKAVSPGVPEVMREAAESVSQMGPQSPFSPGEPVAPFDGYSRTPRSHNFVTGTNIATRPRTHERVSFETLRGLVEAYDIASICIWHRIDSIRSLDWKLMAADNYTGDVTDAIQAGMKALAKPDHENSFETWLAKWLYDVLAYDAGALYRMRNRAGRVVGLAPVDGSTIAPLLDYWGRSPQEPAEAYVQYVNGLPWNWLTRGDLIYEPFRPHNNSPYGHAPIEAVLINANTDTRFQVYFLERFTRGNIPEAFASAPESWSPDQIEQFQTWWDGFIYGDQSVKHPVKWIPGGSTFAWSNEKDFSDSFSLFLMRKTCASFHVVPSDLGFTEDVNRSSGESQADVAHKVGELPFGRYAERIITSYLQDDLGLPLKHRFDWGEEQDDRLQQAQADQIYVNIGSISPSDLREMRYGLAEPEGQPVPRYIFSERNGPIPLASLLALAGEIDAQTAAPVPGSHLPHEAFPGAQGVFPNPPLTAPPLAEQEYGQKALPPAPPQQPGAVAKEGDGGAPTTGITSETGITSYDLDRGDEDEDRAEVAKSELAAFRRFERARRRAGQWRDFEFRSVEPVRAHNLNDAGRLAVRKAAGEIAVAGLAVKAADTGRVLMLQRALSDDDPASGKIEFPGGHREGDESPIQAAWREWSEEVGLAPPPGVQTGSWTAGDGIYQGIVWTTESEASVPVRGETVVPNPDADPDGDGAEAIMWMDPGDLPGNPAVRAELLDSIGPVLAALGWTPDCCTGPCCADGCCEGAGGCPCGSAVAKAGKQPDPKAQQQWAGWRLADADAAYWAPVLTTSLGALLTPAMLERMAAAYLVAFPAQDGTAPGKQARNDAARDWLEGWLAAYGITLAAVIPAAAILADGYLIGSVSAEAAATGTPPDTGSWQPGDSAAAQAQAGGGAMAAVLAAGAVAAAAAVVAGGVISALARALAAAVPEAGHLALSAALAAVVAGRDLATGLILDQIYRASAQAAEDHYGEFVTGDFAWVTDPSLENCVICLGNEAADPRPLGVPWPSGSTAPPVHYRCGCAFIPA